MAHPPVEFKRLQQIFLGIGAASLAVSVLMVFKFGASMSILHAVGLAMSSITVAFIFPAIEYVRRCGMPWGARGLAVVGVGCLALELFAHVGYTIGMRTHSTDSAVVQTAAYDARQEQLQSNKANLAMWREQLSALQKQQVAFDTAKKSNPWIASTSADGLRAMISTADEAIRQEERRGGCGSNCLRLKTQKGELESRIAMAEQVQDLTSRIEATQRIIDSTTEVAVSTEKGFSPVKAQTDFVSQLYLLAVTDKAEQALKPDAVTLTVSQILIGFMLALGMTVLSPAAFYIAFCRAQELADALAAPTLPAAHQTPVSAPQNNVQPHVTLVKQDGWRPSEQWVNETLARFEGPKRVAA